MPAGGWRPQERVSLDEAVRAFTLGAAFAAFDEHDAGTLEVGKRADLTVYDRDLFTAAPDEWLRMRVAMTVVRGEIVYQPH
jgi:predicted amidohydrolase YtcJ